jgi:outer membrane biosynthesis protein TonB
MNHLPLRASAAIASGLALVSLFGAASPALAKGGHHSSETPAAAAPAATAVDTPGVDTPAPAAPAEDTPRVDTPAVDTPSPAAPAEDTPRIDTPAPDTSAPATPAADAPAPATPAADVPAPQAPAPAPFDCLADPAVVAMTTPDLAVNYAGDAGCVAVLVTPGTNRLAWVVPAAGWSYEVERNGGSTNDRVELRFTKAETGDKIDFRYELGKTSIG